MAKTPETPEATKSYKALTHLHHDGKLVRKGSKVALTEKQAKPLQAIGSVAPVTEEKAAE